LKPKMTPAVRAYFQAVAKKGGKARAAKYPAKQLSEWSKGGGRPRALTPEKARELARLQKRGLTQREIAGRLDVSLSTVVRALARRGNDSQNNPA
jgi:DNA-binding NarL/FixJ family response regulator